MQGGNPRVEKVEVVWSEVRGLPLNRTNYVCPSISKDICVGTNMASEGKQGRREVVAQACGGPSHHGKEESTQEIQGKIANSYTLVHENDIRMASSPLSVSSSLLTCESNDSSSLVDDVHIVSVDTLVDPIDDQIDSSCKINLCPPSVEAYMLNESTSSCVIGVDQLICKNCSPLEYVCDMINGTQVSEVLENIGQQKGSEPDSYSWDNLVLETALKLDIDLLESDEHVCFESAREIDHALLRYNVLFEDDITTPNEPSGGND